MYKYLTILLLLATALCYGQGKYAHKTIKKECWYRYEMDFHNDYNGKALPTTIDYTKYSLQCDSEEVYYDNKYNIKEKKDNCGTSTYYSYKNKLLEHEYNVSGTDTYGITYVYNNRKQLVQRNVTWLNIIYKGDYGMAGKDGCIVKEGDGKKTISKPKFTKYYYNNNNQLIRVEGYLTEEITGILILSSGEIDSANIIKKYSDDNQLIQEIVNTKYGTYYMNYTYFNNGSCKITKRAENVDSTKEFVIIIDSTIYNQNHLPVYSSETGVYRVVNENKTLSNIQTERRYKLFYYVEDKLMRLEAYKKEHLNYITEYEYVY